MSDRASNLKSPAALGLRLTQIYVVTAFVFWKLGCFLYAGDSGWSASYDGSPASIAVGIGYLLAMPLLLGFGVIEFMTVQYRKVVSTAIFTGLALLFLAMGSTPDGLRMTQIGYPAAWMLGVVALGWSFRGWRLLKNRAFLLLVWGFAINLIADAGVKLYIAELARAGHYNHFTPGNLAFWNPEPAYSLTVLNGESLLEFYWLGHVISSALITAGLILLVRRLETQNPQTESANTAKNIATGILVLLLGIYPSLVFFGSADFVTGGATQAVMLCFALRGWVRSKSSACLMWALACTVTLLLKIGLQFNDFVLYTPRPLTGACVQLALLSELLSGMLWIAGLMLAVNQLIPAPAPVPWTPRPFTPISPALQRQRLTWMGGVSAVVGAIIWLSAHDPTQVFSFEPKYDGYTLDYWMDHWRTDQYGRPLNGEAETAVRSMGVKAVPYLVKWIARSQNYQNPFAGNSPEHALNGFHALGPVAKPAVPALIKTIGKPDGYPMRALACIGPDAVPALADKLAGTLGDTNPPVWNWRSPSFATSPARIQQCLLGTLSLMGPNAAAAMPVLVRAVHNPNEWTQIEAIETMGRVGCGNPEVAIPALMNIATNISERPVIRAVAGLALADAGKDRPDAVIPEITALFNEFRTNPISRPGSFPIWTVDQLAGTDYGELVINPSNAPAVLAGTLASFGTRAKSSIPVLFQTFQSSNDNLRVQAAVSIEKIAPGTPSALDPLIHDLSAANPGVRKQALETLTDLGTNGLEAFPTVAGRSLYDPNPEVRAAAMRCLSAMDRVNDEIIAALGKNAAVDEETVAKAAVETLQHFAPESEAALRQLARTLFDCPVKALREQVKYTLLPMFENDSGPLTGWLQSSNPETRYLGFRLLDRLNFNLGAFPQAVPALTLAIHGKIPEARSLATNMLTEFYTSAYGRRVLRVLVQGADPNAADDQGLTALQAEIVSPGPDPKGAIIALLDAGADPNVRDSLGRTPVDLLLSQPWPWSGARDLFPLLTSRGASLSATDNQGRTPLHYLAALGNNAPLLFVPGLGDQFVRAKVNFQARDHDGNTPLHIAVQSGTYDVYHWLIAQGASADATNNAGLTPGQLIERLPKAIDRLRFTQPQVSIRLPPQHTP